MGSADLSLTWATLTPGGARLRLRASSQDDDRVSRPRRRTYRVLPGQRLAEEIRSGLSVTDNLGQRYRLRPVRWSGGTGTSGATSLRWDGEILAEPEPRGAGLVRAEGQLAGVRYRV